MPSLVPLAMCTPKILLGACVLRSSFTLTPLLSPPISVLTCPGGTMALLCAGVGADRIRLVGRWRSDELYRYLHVQAQQVMTGLSAKMLTGGNFRLAPG